MPARDGRGPQGRGPRTGRAYGNCQGPDNVNVLVSEVEGLPCGPGARGMGRGRRCFARGRGGFGPGAYGPGGYGQGGGRGRGRGFR